MVLSTVFVSLAVGCFTASAHFSSILCSFVLRRSPSFSVVLVRFASCGSSFRLGQIRPVSSLRFFCVLGSSRSISGDEKIRFFRRKSLFIVLIGPFGAFRPSARVICHLLVRSLLISCEPADWICEPPAVPPRKQPLRAR